MTLINTYTSEAEAGIVAGMLQSNGIRCEVTVEATSSVYPTPLTGSELVGLYVEDDDAVEARRLLKEHGDY